MFDTVIDMSTREWKSEAEMAAVLVEWLKNKGWDVYQEVVGRGGVADIVAVKDELLWVIESKLTFGLKVLDQAHGWLKSAHYVSVATPQWGRKNGHDFGRLVCHQFGIGALIVTGRYVSEPVRAQRVDRPNSGPLRSALCEEQKTFAAAGTNRGHWTPFKGFAKRLADIVSKHVIGIPVKDAAMLEGLHGYYPAPANFRRNVPPLCQRGAIPGVRCAQTTARGWCLFPCSVGEEVDGG